MLKIGDKAPNFTLSNKDGNNISLSDFLGKKVVIYFYPKDNTPGCTRQACAFAQSYEEFKNMNVEVIGISKDSISSHQKFAEKHSPIVAEMCENDPMKIGGKTAFAAMRKGCPDSAEVVKYYISHLATGIANLINIFQPNVFLIGGGVCNEGDPLLLPLKEEVRHLIYSADKILKTDIRIATLGNDAGIIGAAALARK